MKRAVPKSERKANVLLDSGAFSAWNKGAQIDLKEYIKFVKANSHLVGDYVCLDTIPGSMGRMDRSQESIDKSAAASYKNQQIMKDAGLRPIPVFHQGEKMEWLERYVAEGEPYIGISPYMRSTQSTLIAWLDECFTRITDKEGRPVVKTHGFGVTSHEVLWRYPWQSVDSTTWAIAPAYGMLILPAQGIDGDADMRLPARQFYVGDGAIDSDTRKRIDSLGDFENKWLHKYAEICGTSVVAFRNDQYSRTTAHIMYFKLVEQARGEVRFAQRRARFFGAPGGRSSRKPVKVDFRVIFATNLTNKQCLILTRLDARNRLLSYWDLGKYKDATERLEQYVTNGHLSGALEGRNGNDVGGDIPAFEPAVRVNWDTHNYTDFRRRRLAGRFVGATADDDDGQERAT